VETQDEHQAPTSAYLKEQLVLKELRELFVGHVAASEIVSGVARDSKEVGRQGHLEHGGWRKQMETGHSQGTHHVTATVGADGWRRWRRTTLAWGRHNLPRDPRDVRDELNRSVRVRERAQRQARGTCPPGRTPAGTWTCSSLFP
jgi:hypothetical protein